MSLSSETKTAINAVIYGIVSVIVGAAGVIALSQDLPLLGGTLIAFGIAGFGWSCISGDWLFNKKKNEV
ncbi:MAG: hypothetical protein ACT4NT_07465 [Nitrososphaerota archaeon]